jgi:hypothetical protein
MWSVSGLTYFQVMFLRLRLIVIAYVPLYIVIAAQYFPSSWAVGPHLVCWLVCVVVVVLCLADAVNIIGRRRTVAPMQFQVTRVSDGASAVAGYLVTYVLPFVALNLRDWRLLAALGIYLAVLVVVSIRSNLGLVNPTLYLLGWRTYEVVIQQTAGPRESIVVSRHEIREGINSWVVLSDGFIQRG